MAVSESEALESNGCPRTSGLYDIFAKCFSVLCGRAEQAEHLDRVEDRSKTLEVDPNGFCKYERKLMLHFVK